MPNLSTLASIICVTATWFITLVSLISIGFFKRIASSLVRVSIGFYKLYTVMFLGFAIVSSANTVLTLMYDKPTDERSMEQIIALVSLDIVQYALLTVI